MWLILAVVFAGTVDWLCHLIETAPVVEGE